MEASEEPRDTGSPSSGVIQAVTVDLCTHGESRPCEVKEHETKIRDDSCELSDSEICSSGGA
eukprot:6554555-Alexandrium_andersonii.AAC.1